MMLKSICWKCCGRLVRLFVEELVEMKIANIPDGELFVIKIGQHLGPSLACSSKLIRLQIAG